MKPYNIALFKHFLEGKGMVTPFVNMFKSYPLRKNSNSIEEYLRNVDEGDVCLHAFYFVINSRWGYNYWYDTQKEFMEYLKEHEDDPGKDEWYLLNGKSKILRTNWDTKHWKQEPKVAAAKRLGIELPEYETNEDEQPKNNEANNFVEEQDTEKLDIKTYIKGKEEEKMDIFGEFEFLEIKKQNNRRKLADDEISINTRSGHGQITFNLSISGDIRKRGGYEYAALLKNKKNEVAIIFNDIKGVTINDGSNNKSNNSNIRISNKELVEKVATFLGLENDYTIVKVTEIEKTDDYVAYILTK
jgi:hypothetical protein